MTIIPTDVEALRRCLAAHYGLQVDRLEPFRDSGNATFVARAHDKRYFLRVTKPAFHDTARTAIDVHAYLQARRFAVPELLYTLDHRPCVEIEAADGTHLLALTEFLEGGALENGEELEATGALLGQLHADMADYPGELVTRDRHYFIDRFDAMLRAKAYPRISAFSEIAEAIWKSVEGLPRGYAHGDAYCGNFHRTLEGRLYLLDLDTSCRGIPAYDLALFGNCSDYFELGPDDALRTKQAFDKILPAYCRFHQLTGAEERALYRLIALSHFALQPTIVEIFGLDCIDEEFLDKQLLWHERWRRQCEALGLW